MHALGSSNTLRTRLGVLAVVLGFGVAGANCSSGSDSRQITPATDSGKKKDAEVVEDQDSDVIDENAKCKRTLTFGKIGSLTNSQCTINEEVSNQESDVEYDCKGGGHAEVTFGTQLFEGKVQGDLVNLSNVEPFVYDGCDWQSTQLITGDLSEGSLDYRYSEKVIKCNDPSQQPCTADGKFTIKATDEEVIR